MLEYAAAGAVFLLNAPGAPHSVWERLPRELQQQMIEKSIRFFTIDAYAVAKETGMGSRINTIMQTCYFAISGVLPRAEAIAKIKKAIEKTYGKMGAETIRRNFEAVDQTLARLHEIPLPGAVTASRGRPPLISEKAPDFVQKVTAVMMAGKGDLLPVSAFPVDGTWPVATGKWEKRAIALDIPVWDTTICIQCNMCALVCPHAAIRAKIYDPGALGKAPATFKSTPYKGVDFKNKDYTIQVAPEDCTGCNLCVNVCPAKDRTNPRHKAIDMQPMAPLRDAERENYSFFLNLPETERSEVIRLDHKGSQFLEPLFEYSGASFSLYVTSHGVVKSTAGYFQSVGKQDNSDTRLTLWQLTIKQIDQSPVYGHLFTNDLSLSVPISLTGFTRVEPHNDYLQVAMQGGLLALAAYVRVDPPRDPAHAADLSPPAGSRAEGAGQARARPLRRLQRLLPDVAREPRATSRVHHPQHDPVARRRPTSGRAATRVTRWSPPGCGRDDRSTPGGSRRARPCRWLTARRGLHSTRWPGPRTVRKPGGRCGASSTRVSRASATSRCRCSSPAIPHPGIRGVRPGLRHLSPPPRRIARTVLAAAHAPVQRRSRRHPTLGRSKFRRTRGPGFALAAAPVVLVVGTTSRRALQRPAAARALRVRHAPRTGLLALRLLHDGDANPSDVERHRVDAGAGRDVCGADLVGARERRRTLARVGAPARRSPRLSVCCSRGGGRHWSADGGGSARSATLLRR